MKNLNYLIMGAALFFSAPSLYAGSGSCPLCEKVREYNASHPENNYYWYEDYLKETGQSREQGSGQAENGSQSPAAELND